MAKVITAIDLSAGEARCHVVLADLGAAPALLAAVVAALPADPLRGRVRVARTDGRAVSGCFACDRPLTPRAGRAGRFVAARLAVAMTPTLAAEVAAAPGYAPAWSIVPVAPPRSAA